MPSESQADAQVEIGHVLCTDIVGYSRLSIDRQKESLGQLNAIVRSTPQFQRAEAAGKLVRLPSPEFSPPDGETAGGGEAFCAKVWATKRKVSAIATAHASLPGFHRASLFVTISAF
jgi:hypothetical protein